MMGPRPQCYIPSHKVTGPLVLEKTTFEGFLPYMGETAILFMWPKPCKQTFVPHPTEAPYKIWLWLAQQFWRRSLKMVDGQTTDRPWLYYKLTFEPKGSGELKSNCIFQILPPFCHWPEEILPKVWLYCKHLHVSLTFTVRKNDVTPSNVKKTWSMGRMTS